MNTNDIARRAGVSVGTVSNVVNGKNSVSQEVRERVLKTMAEAGWQPNELARGLRRPSAKLVVMFIPDILNPFFPAVVSGAESLLSQAGYRLLLCSTENRPERELVLLDELQGFSAAGYLVVPATKSRLASRFKAMSKPIIYLDRAPTSWRGDAVVADNEGGAFAATKYLLQRGHRRIAIITGPRQSPNAAARLAGFRRALSEGGCSLEDDYVQVGRFDRVSGLELAGQLMKAKSPPTAIFASNDMIAMGCLMAFRDSGLTCPDDVSLVGFDNLDSAELMDPALTTVHQPGDRIGIEGAKLLLERLSGNGAVGGRRVVLPTELRIRASVRRIRGRS